MAFINSNLFSNVLMQDVHVDLYTPNDYEGQEIKQAEGIIYILHGHESSEKQFREFTSASRYARENNLIALYLSAPRGWYNDMYSGWKYYTYITEELPQLLKAVYNIEFPREKTFIAGFSMGGYGALRIGLSKPEMFGAICAISPLADIRKAAQEIIDAGMADGENMLFDVFGPGLPIKDEQDPFWLIEQVAKMPAEKQPGLFLCVGKQDAVAGIKEQTRHFRQVCEDLNLANFKYLEWEGIHDYAFADRAILHGVAFFAQNDYDEQKLALWKS